MRWSWKIYRANYSLLSFYYNLYVYSFYITQQWCILRFLTMEVKSELTHEISLLWKLFNEVFSQITVGDYKLHPKAVMLDENGANYCAIKQVFGLVFKTSKVVIWQMHYKHDASKASFIIVVSFRDELKNICYEMCTVATIAQCNEQDDSWMKLLTSSLT